MSPSGAGAHAHDLTVLAAEPGGDERVVIGHSGDRDARRCGVRARRIVARRTRTAGSPAVRHAASAAAMQSPRSLAPTSMLINATWPRWARTELVAVASRVPPG